MSVSPALVELRSDVSTFKVQLTAVKKSLQAEVKTLTVDLKRVKAAAASKTLLTKSFASSVTLPEAQLTRSLGTLVTKSAGFVAAATAYSKKITSATTARYLKTQAALNTAFGTENTLAGELYSTRLSTLSTTVISLSTATADPTTEADANTLAASVTTDNTAFSVSQVTIADDVGSLGSTNAA